MTALDDIRAKRFEGSEPIGVVMDHTGAGPDGHGGTLERRGVAKLGYAWEAAQVLFRRRVWESGGKQCVGLGCSSTLTSDGLLRWILPQRIWNEVDTVLPQVTIYRGEDELAKALASLCRQPVRPHV
jgi:hypothetical protein